MIISKSPLRISFFGGSTDYKSFYEEHGSLIIGTTIDKYVYVSCRKRPRIFQNESVITYSKQELIKDCKWDDVEHPLIREVLKFYGVEYGIDIHTFSDIPSRTGLGGSSSFCVSLLKSLFEVLWPINIVSVGKRHLAEIAVNFERNILKEPGGIQDQIWASYGGLNSIEIKKDGKFTVRPLAVSEDFKREFENSLILVYTGDQRETLEVAEKHESSEEAKLQIKNHAILAYDAFQKEDIPRIGELLGESWEHKKSISKHISNETVDSISKSMMDAGCYGTKLCGAGGGGFVLGIGDYNTIKYLRRQFGDKVLDFKFDTEGSTYALR